MLEFPSATYDIPKFAAASSGPSHRGGPGGTSSRTPSGLGGASGSKAIRVVLLAAAPNPRRRPKHVRMGRRVCSSVLHPYPLLQPDALAGRPAAFSGTQRDDDAPDRNFPPDSFHWHSVRLCCRVLRYLCRCIKVCRSSLLDAIRACVESDQCRSSVCRFRRCTLHVCTGRVLHMRAVWGTLAPARMPRPHASPAARRRLSVRSAPCCTFLHSFLKVITDDPA